MTEYYSIQSYQDTIQHFGVKGMKWGQRRVVSSFGAARAQKKLRRLNKRMTDTMGNRFKNELATIPYGGTIDGQYRRIQNGWKIEKQKAKILSNKKGISYKDAYKQIRKPYDGSTDAARAKWKESAKEYGKRDPRTLRDKMNYRSEHNKSMRKDLIDKSGFYALERTQTNSYINDYGRFAERNKRKAMNYSQMARNAGLKG